MTNPYIEQLKVLENKGGPVTGASRSSTYDPTNPYAAQLAKATSNLHAQSDNFSGEDDTHENDSSFTHTLGSFVDYLTSLRGNASTGINLPKSSNPVLNTIAAGNDGNDPANSRPYNKLQQDEGIVSNIGKSISNGIDFFKNNSASQIANKTLDTISNGVSGATNNPSGFAGGMFKGFVEKPIEALTSTVNEDGTARPANLQEQVQNLQSAAGLAAQLGMFKAVSAGMIGDIPTSVDAATNALRPIQLGRLAVGGGIKQGAKYLASEAAAGAISGGIGAAISSMGQDNQAEAVISGALSFMPLTIALGAFGVKGHINDLREARSTLQDISTNSSTPAIAALNALRVNPSDPVSTLIKNISVATSADDLISAAIRSKLQVGDGYMVEGVSPGVGQQLVDGVMPSQATYPDNYIPPEALNKPRPRPNSTEVKFDSPFDKLAYLAAKSKPSPYVESLIEDAMQQTGLTRDEIVSHGKYVRMKQLSEFKNGKLIPRTQAEIDAYNQASLLQGQKKVDASAEGTVIKDSNGETWTRVGNSFRNKDGSQILPIDQANTLHILGRKASDTPFYQPFQQLGKQVFNPNFSRIDTDLPVPINYHYSNNGTLLVTPTNYKPEVIAFFKKTGFIPGEIVTSNGVDHVINGYEHNGFIGATELNSGIKKEFQPNRLRRTNNSLTPDVIQGVGVKAPVLTKDGLLDNLYTKFRDEFNNAPPDLSFSGFTQKFYSENGIEEKDYNHISTLFTKRLADDLANTNLSPEELAARQKIQSKFSALSQSQIDDHSSWLANQARSNNLFYSPEGGQYRLRFADSGKTYAVVSTPEEALAAINKIRQSSGLPLDGGYSGPVPSDIASIGGLSDSYQYKYSKVDQAIDKSRFAGFLSHFAPVYRMLQSGDNYTKGNGIDTNFGNKFLDLQKALMNRKNIVSSDPGINSLSKIMQSAVDFGASIKPDRRLVLADNLDAMSIDDIKNRYLPRQMSVIEDGLAKEMAKNDPSKIQQLLYDAKSASPNSNVGSEAYLTTLNKVAADQKIDPSIVKSAHAFSAFINTLDPKSFNGDAVLRLAQAYENPDLAISQIQHARANKITPQELKYIDLVKKSFSQAASVAGIDPELQYQMYLPSLRRQIAVGGSSDIPTEFAREMNRVGITPENQLIRDPNQLMTKYFASVVNHKSGFSEALSKFQTDINAEADKLTGTPIESVVAPFKAQMADYVGQVQGHKTPGDNLWSAVRKLDGELGMKSPSVNSVMQAMALGSIALRPALAVRDFMNIAGLAYTSFGHEFTQHFLTDAVSSKYVEDMKKKNLLPDKMGSSVRDPQVDQSDLIAHKFPMLNKMADATFSISGQETAYEHANAGIYQASLNMAEKYFELLRNKSMSKEAVYDKLGISSNYGPGVIAQIDKHLVNGRTDLAADFYGQANMRYLSHVYGFHNNPLGWNTVWGRLLSQWGSWSANASQTAIDQFTRGSKKQIASKMLRLGIFNGAMVGVGAGLGFNLKSWTISNPMTVWPNVGPLAGLTNDFSDDFDQGRASVSGELGKLMSGFIPYSKAAEGWVKGLDLVGQGKLLQGIGKGLGAPVSNP